MAEGVERRIGRRGVLAAALVLTGSVLAGVAGRGVGRVAAGAAARPGSEACAVPAEATPAATAGPYFSPGSPERTSLLEPDLAGTRLLLSGQVLTTGCRPLAGALLDFWQADAAGQYDNRGYRLRGHQFSDADGRYALETVAPGLYPGRTSHIHVRVLPPGGRALTTQLYFPGAARNGTDPLFSQRLLIAVEETPEGLLGTFDFVLPA